MGAARIEIFSKNNKYHGYPDAYDKVPLQVELETTSTTETTAGSRHVVDSVGNGRQLFARIQVNEACYVAIGADPTASPTALGWLLAANVPLEVAVAVGDKFSFEDVA